jgi:serine protease inhibitor
VPSRHLRVIAFGGTWRDRVRHPAGSVFDRPFVFLIRERLSGTILFTGVVRDPRA